MNSDFLLATASFILGLAVACAFDLPSKIERLIFYVRFTRRGSDKVIAQLEAKTAAMARKAGQSAFALYVNGAHGMEPHLFIGPPDQMAADAFNTGCEFAGKRVQSFQVNVLRGKLDGVALAHAFTEGLAVIPRPDSERLN